MEGYVYTRDNNGTKEAVVTDKNTGRTIALSAFSGYLALSGGIISEGMKHAAQTAKDIARRIVAGKIYAIADGVISGTRLFIDNYYLELGDYSGSGSCSNDVYKNYLNKLKQLITHQNKLK